ncbi:pantetheine-phosphate adenylyltransferase [Neofamilia massiliensis]|uniref:pantetheine-phosphate adenylyltransferase n=1 Tax=Neofamilia massiliensis TaxID=1673724 RepID=UPI0006BB53ED|nr:pantetheine-phosphate adenylyltransferase [Neofamilia massiliensis]
MKVIYPGSFDPVTNGHLDIIQRAAKNFDEVTVAILDNKSKSPLFTIEERIAMLKEATKSLENVNIDSFSGLLVDYVAKSNTNTVLRGLRAISDYENEMRNALANNSLNNDVETIFMVSKSEYTFLSSSVVKEIASFNGDVKNMVPEVVCKQLKEKYK